MVFENSWLNHDVEEICMEWFLADLKKYKIKFDIPEDVIINVEEYLKELKQKCGFCMKKKIEVMKK